MRVVMQTALTLAFAMLLPSTALAADLTGTYEGKETCIGWSGSTTRSSSDKILEISQVGGGFVAKRRSAGGGGFITTYTGELAEDVSRPTKARGSALSCDDFTPNAVWSTLEITKATDKDGQAGKITAEIVRAFVPEVTTVYRVCKFRGKRTSSVDPGVACP